MGRYAICINAGLDDVGSAVSGLEYARSLLDADHTVAVYLDAEAVKWPGEVASRRDHPVKTALLDLKGRGAIEGACEYCADVYDASQGCDEFGVTLVGTAKETHGPDVGELASRDFELLTVG